jgi:hypothetical protein
MPATPARSEKVRTKHKIPKSWGNHTTDAGETLASQMRRQIALQLLHPAQKSPVVPFHPPEAPPTELCAVPGIRPGPAPAAPAAPTPAALPASRSARDVGHPASRVGGSPVACYVDRLRRPSPPRFIRGGRGRSAPRCAVAV